MRKSRRESGGRNIPSLPQRRCNKSNNIQGLESREKHGKRSEKEKQREENGVKEKAPCQVAPPAAASVVFVLLRKPCSPSLFKREVCDSTLNIKDTITLTN